METFNVSGEIFSIPEQIRRDLEVIRRNLGQISTDPARFRPDLVESGQISASTVKPETDPKQPETDKTRTEKSGQSSGSVSGQIFIHPTKSGRFRVGHKPDPARPVDTPNPGRDI